MNNNDDTKRGVHATSADIDEPKNVPRFAVPPKPKILQSQGGASIRLGVPSSKIPQAKAPDHNTGDKVEETASAASGNADAMLHNLEQAERFRSLIDNFRKQREIQHQNAPATQAPKPIPKAIYDNDRPKPATFTLPSSLRPSAQSNEASTAESLEPESPNEAIAKQGQRFPEFSLPLNFDNHQILNDDRHDPQPPVYDRPFDKQDTDHTKNYEQALNINIPENRLPEAPTFNPVKEAAQFTTEPSNHELTLTSEGLTSSQNFIPPLGIAPSTPLPPENGPVFDSVNVPPPETPNPEQIPTETTGDQDKEDLFKPFTPRQQSHENFTSADDAIGGFNARPADQPAPHTQAINRENIYERAKRQNLGKYGRVRTRSKAGRFGLISLYALITVILSLAIVFALMPSFVEQWLTPTPPVIGANIDDGIVTKPEDKPQSDPEPPKGIFETDDKTLSNNVKVIDNQAPIVIKNAPAVPPKSFENSETISGMSDADHNLADSIDQILASIETEYTGDDDHVTDQSVTVVKPIDLNRQQGTPSREVPDQTREAPPQTASESNSVRQTDGPTAIDHQASPRSEAQNNRLDVQPVNEIAPLADHWIGFERLPKARIEPLVANISDAPLTAEPAPALRESAEPVKTDPNAPVSITIPFDKEVVKTVRPVVDQSSGTDTFEPTNDAQPQTATGSQYEVQISSQPSRDLANTSLVSLAARYADLIDRGKAFIRADTLPNGNRTHRVLLGPYNSSNQADRVCGQIQAQGGECFRRRLR